MDKNTLLHRKDDVETRYNQLAQDKITLEGEMSRLQGEHRLLIDLLETSSVEKPKRLRKVEVVEDATN